jgi:methionyl-tRNA formyltransferase
MRIVFAGTPAFSVQVLSRLLDAGHHIALVLAQPDRPKGRGLKPQPGPLVQLATARGLEVFQPASLKDRDSLQRVEASGADVMVTAAYGLIVPKSILEVPPHGALNVHASLLPRWRGAAPIQRALLAGDLETGATIIRMDEGLDTGPILGQRATRIETEDDAGSLHDRLASLGAELLLRVLEDCAAGCLHARDQPATGATYARKIEASETILDWLKPAQQLEREVRAFRPAPGAQTWLRGVRCKVWRAAVVQGSGEAGRVLGAGREGIRVGCGEGVLAILELQRAGSRRMRAEEFLRGFPVAEGERFASAG